MPYEKGQSGNPAGRPLGARNRATIVVETLLQGQVEPMTRVAMDLALGGDMAALRMCLDRVAPPGRHRPIAYELPPLRTAADAAAALAQIAADVAVGELTPWEAGELCKLVDNFRRALEATDFEKQLAELRRDVDKPAAGGGTEP